MNLNLITDSWIPVRDRTGNIRHIAPWQMADPDLQWPVWPRVDLEIACLELLIGLLLLADPPADADDWEARAAPDPERLKARLEAFSLAFNLLGDGPRFMQELGGLTGGISPVELLFIDSGGEGGTLTNHAGRYPDLTLPIAAMALYAMQTQAPSGGRGHLTSIRGGGGMTVLVDPGQGLWPLLWANVPNGVPGRIEDLPWMRRTIPSDGGAIHVPPEPFPAESLFSMPRRYWLTGCGDRITGLIQRPSGTRYVGWQHPFTPYYHKKAGDDPLPVRPRAGPFGYRHWQGIVFADKSEMKLQPHNIRLWQDRAGSSPAGLVLAGWAMDNAKARDYAFARPPLINLSDDAELLLTGMIQAADALSRAVCGALGDLVAKGKAQEIIRENFYFQTHGAFDSHLAQLQQPDRDIDKIARCWLRDMEKVGTCLFEEQALPGLDDRSVRDQERIVSSHRMLRAAFAGYTKLGGSAFDALLLPRPESRQKGGR